MPELTFLELLMLVLGYAVLGTGIGLNSSTNSFEEYAWEITLFGHLTADVQEDYRLDNLQFLQDDDASIQKLLKTYLTDGVVQAFKFIGAGRTIIALVGAGMGIGTTFRGNGLLFNKRLTTRGFATWSRR